MNPVLPQGLLNNRLSQENKPLHYRYPGEGRSPQQLEANTATGLTLFHFRLDTAWTMGDANVFGRCNDAPELVRGVLLCRANRPGGGCRSYLLKYMVLALTRGA